MRYEVRELPPCANRPRWGIWDRRGQDFILNAFGDRTGWSAHFLARRRAEELNLKDFCKEQADAPNA